MGDGGGGNINSDGRVYLEKYSQHSQWPWSIFAYNPICQIGFWVRGKRPIIGCFRSLKCLKLQSTEQSAWTEISVSAGARFSLHTDVAKFHPIWYLLLFLGQVLSGLGHICNVGTQAGQSCLRTPSLNGVFTPCHIYWLISGTRSKAEPPQNSTKGISPPVLTVALLIFRMGFLTLSITPSPAQIVWLPLSRLSQQQFYYYKFQMFQVDWMKMKLHKSHAVSGAFKCFRTALNINSSTFALVT